MDDSAREDSVVLTKDTCRGNIPTTEREEQRSVAYGLLSRLADGTPVALTLDDPRMPKKARAKKPVLFLTPVTVFGRPSPSLVVSLQAWGCEVIDTRSEIKAMPFLRLGISITLSKVLASELNLVFNLKRRSK